MSIQAGRLMLARLDELLAAGETFALETTLATRHYLRFIEEARAQGYVLRLLFFWLSSADLAVERVAARVREGGHNIPESVIRRRYESGLKLFFRAYCHSVDSWLFVDNSDGLGAPVAEVNGGGIIVMSEFIWQSLTAIYDV